MSRCWLTMSLPSSSTIACFLHSVSSVAAAAKVRALNSAGWSEWSSTTPQAVELLSEDEIAAAVARAKGGKTKKSVMDNYKVLSSPRSASARRDSIRTSGAVEPRVGLTPLPN